MYCPFCSHDITQVLETRYQEDDNSIKRKRKCESCHGKFVTFESVQLSFPLVIKKDNSRQAYQRKKIEKSLMLALRKRPISIETLHITIQSIEQILLLIPKEISSQEIGILIMEALKKLDKIAYIRFASVYKNFENISDFKSVMKELGKNNG